ncbi:putative RNA-directed DNA polymerase, partial [Aphis craccivora]
MYKIPKKFLNLHVFYQNVRVLTLDCDLLFLSETWLNINYSDEELGLVNYNIFRADREFSHEVRGGGVLLAINIKYNCIRIPTESIVGIDFIFTLLNYNNSKLLLSCVYIPPNTHDYSDFDIPGLCGQSMNLHQIILLIWLQICNNVTNHRQDILDLIFSDSLINNIRKSLSLTPIFDAYHPPWELIYPLTTSPVTLIESLTPIMYNFNSCNFDEMCTFLSEIDFIHNFKNLNLVAATSKFYEIIRHTFDVYVTKFKFNHNQNTLWKDPVLRNLIQLKKQAHKQFKLSNSQHDYFSFSELRKKCKALSVKVHANHILKIENNINSDSKYFWKYIQSLRSNKTNIPATVYLDNIVSDNINYTTKLFADYFSS